MDKLLPFFLLSPLFVGLTITFQGIDSPSMQLKATDDSSKVQLTNSSDTQKAPCTEQSEKGCPEERRETKKT